MSRMNVFQTHKSQSCRHRSCFSIGGEAPSYVFGFGKATAEAEQALSSQVAVNFEMQKDTKDIAKSNACAAPDRNSRTPHPRDRMTGFQTLHPLPRAHEGWPCLLKRSAVNT